jgi:hypothetical protein
MNTSIDLALKKIDSLFWLPWVGPEYQNIVSPKMKLLVVAESHYDWGEDGARDDLEDRRFTRWFVTENAINSPDKIMNVLRNAERAIYGAHPTKDQKLRLWNSACYYNFVQTILDSKDHRPADKDYEIGWNTFFRIVDVLMPDYCLFCGVQASNWVYYFNQALLLNNYRSSGFKKYDKIGSTYPKTTTITGNFGKSSKLLFIRHTSRYFSWKRWSVFVNDQMPNYVSSMTDKNLN